MGYDMLHNDRKRIQDSIRRIGNQETIDGIRVFNKAGEVIYSSNPAEVGLMVDMEATSCYRCHLTDTPVKLLKEQEHMRIFRTDPDSPRQLGIIMLVGSLSQAPQSTDRARGVGCHHAAHQG
jgi:hypothetical protein